MEGVKTNAPCWIVRYILRKHCIVASLFIFKIVFLQHVIINQPYIIIITITTILIIIIIILSCEFHFSLIIQLISFIVQFNCFLYLSTHFFSFLIQLTSFFCYLFYSFLSSFNSPVSFIIQFNWFLHNSNPLCLSTLYTLVYIHYSINLFLSLFN